MTSKDTQTVLAGGGRAALPRISGVRIHELGNVLTRSGYLTEVFRTDWAAVGITVRQVNWVSLDPQAVTDWHFHEKQTDHLVGVGGHIKLALWDGRGESTTKGATEIIRMGEVRPVMVVVPPGVWHALRNLSGAPAGYLNLTDELYAHQDPDNWRAAAGSVELPDIL